MFFKHTDIKAFHFKRQLKQEIMKIVCRKILKFIQVNRDLESFGNTVLYKCLEQDVTSNTSE